MKARTSKIGLIVATMSFAIMFVGYVLMCEQIPYSDSTNKIV